MEDYKFDTLIIVSYRYETEVFSEWTQGVDEVAKTNLDKPLIVRNPRTLFISVNFDPKVCKINESNQEFCIIRNYFIHLGCCSFA